MKPLLLLVLPVCLTWGCSQVGSGEFKPISAAPSSDASQPIVATKPGHQTPPRTKPSEPSPPKESFKGSEVKEHGKPMPVPSELVGTYQFEVDKALREQMDSAIKRIQDDVAKGDKQAEKALPLALAAREMALDMNLVLKPDGRFESDMGRGKSVGKYKTTEKGIVIVPDEKTGDPNDPTEMELIWDKKEQALIVDLDGKQMKFKKTS